MKKIVSILLALLLVCLPMAVAESATNNAALIGLQNIEVMGNSLGDMQVWAGIEAADAPLFTITASAGEEILASAVGEFVDDEIRVMFSNNENAYAAKLADLAAGLPPQAAAALPQLPELLKQAIPELANAVLPLIPAITIPQIDLSAMLGGGDSFELTTEQIDSLMGMAEAYIDMAGSKVPQADQVKEAIGQLKGKLAVNGTFASDGNAKVTRANILFDGEEVGTLVLTSEENNTRLALEANGAEQGGLTIVSDPDTATLDVDVDVAGDTMGGFSLFQEDGLQKIIFEINAGEKIGMEFDYGNQNGRDIVSLVMDVDSQGSFDFVVDTAMGEDGERTGTVSFDGDFNGSEVSFSADVIMGMVESLDVGEITWPETLLPFSDIDLTATLQPVQDYLQGIAQDDAA